jgi:hypothetical protein
MVSDPRLLILSCSQRKRPEAGLLPAIERYDGPAFWVLRRFLREQPEKVRQLDVFILSAAYGLISAEYPIRDYDQVMTSQRAAELHDEVLGILTSSLSGNNYGSVCLAMSKAYLAALEGWSALIPQGVRVVLTDGPQGVKLAKLKRWLWGDIQDHAEDKQREAKIRGYARIRGVEVAMTPEQVLGIARSALSEGRGMSDCYYSWYIQVDNQRIAPKWLVSQLTGLPVSAFVSSEARRFLAQLGVEVTHV